MLSVEKGRYAYHLTLECGHVARRRYICVPERVICEECPAAGGIRLTRS